MAKKITSSEICSAMSKRWAEPEYAIMWEVTAATGAVAQRRADAVIMSLWPSRGLELHGVEIKVSRADWKREAADPTKAEAVARYCDRWWVHAAPGVVQDLSEIPPAWGLREWDGSVWATKREAAKTDAAPIDRGFLAALLRRADGAMRRAASEMVQVAREQLALEREETRRRFDEIVAERVARKTKDLDSRAKNVASFEKAFGFSATDYAENYIALGRAARALCQCNETGFGDLALRLRKAADEIEAIAALSGGNDG